MQVHLCAVKTVTKWHFEGTEVWSGGKEVMTKEICLLL